MRTSYIQDKQRNYCERVRTEKASVHGHNATLYFYVTVFIGPLRFRAKIAGNGENSNISLRPVAIDRFVNKVQPE